MLAVYAYDRVVMESYFTLALDTGSAAVMALLFAIHRDYTERRRSPLDKYARKSLWARACYKNRLDIAEIIWTNVNVDVSQFELGFGWPMEVALRLKQVKYMLERIATKVPLSSIDTEWPCYIAAHQNTPEIIDYMIQKGMYIHPKVWEGVLDRKNHKLAKILRAHNVAITPMIIGPYVWDDKIESLEFMAKCGYTPGNSDFPGYRPDLSRLISERVHDFLRDHQERWKKYPNWAKVMVSDDEEKEREIAWRQKDIPDAPPAENEEDEEEEEEAGEEEEEEEVVEEEEEEEEA